MTNKYQHDNIKGIVEEFFAAVVLENTDGIMRNATSLLTGVLFDINRIADALEAKRAGDVAVHTIATTQPETDASANLRQFLEQNYNAEFEPGEWPVQAAIRLLTSAKDWKAAALDLQNLWAWIEREIPNPVKDVSIGQSVINLITDLSAKLRDARAKPAPASTADDFAGWLTVQPEVVECGASVPIYQMMEKLAEYKKLKNIT